MVYIAKSNINIKTSNIYNFTTKKDLITVLHSSKERVVLDYVLKNKINKCDLLFEDEDGKQILYAKCEKPSAVLEDMVDKIQISSCSAKQDEANVTPSTSATSENKKHFISPKEGEELKDEEEEDDDDKCCIV